MSATTPRRLTGAVSIACAVTLIGGAGASASPIPLPAPGVQVNDDPANLINPAESAFLSDVAGGTLTPGGIAVPWAAFEQASGGTRQIFVRAFKNGQWVTEGPSLNVSPGEVAEAPSIDFAGANRAVPWVAWYEPNANTGNRNQIFASRFDSGANLWRAAGQDRAGGVTPSLNIDTTKDAENPAVAGGTTVAGGDPEPWVTWQETGSNGKFQIFTSKGVKTSGANCAVGTKPAGGQVLNGFCWQQVGIERLGVAPSMNIDTGREGVEPDIAFTGPSDTVPWVVWYEEGAGSPGLAGNKMVFAAKAKADPAADGGFKWVVEGLGTEGLSERVLDNGPSGGPCAASLAAEKQCAINADPTADAENIRVAAGTMTPGGTTVPWVVWDEARPGGRQIFAARLVGGDHFELANGGQPLSTPGVDASKPDITFSGNTPYVTWLEGLAAKTVTVGHLANVNSFVKDATGISRTAAGVADGVRAPITSSCTANPFNADGAACQGGAVGSPAYLFLEAGTPSRLFSDGYSPTSATTGSASSITAGSARVATSVNGGGGPTRAVVEFGPTTSYGSTTAAQELAPGATDASFDLTGLPAGTTIHYRIVAAGDFGSVAGADATFTTALNPVAPDTKITKSPKAKVRLKGRKKAKVVFKFRSVPAGATFQCRIKRSASFKSCSTPKTFRLRRGKYAFAVRAVSGGLVDPTPATRKFRVVR